MWSMGCFHSHGTFICFLITVSLSRLSHGHCICAFLMGSSCTSEEHLFRLRNTVIGCPYFSLGFFLIRCFPSNWNLDFWKVIAENLSEEEIKGLKQMFNNMDTDKSGTITLDELKTGLSRLGSRLTEIEIKQLMDAVSTVNLSHYPVWSVYLLIKQINHSLWYIYIYSSLILQETNHVSSYIISLWLMYFFFFVSFCQADVDRSGTIDYYEFITATMHRHKLDKEENLYKAFQYFDTDQSGLVCWFFELCIWSAI